MLSILKRNNFFLFDLYMIIYIITVSIHMLTTHMLVQDKICRNIYNQTEFFCQNINKDIFDGQEQIDKDKVLSDTALFQNYNNLITLAPMFVYSLFVGSFLDRYPGATKLLAAWLNLMQILNVIYFIINVHIFSLSPYLLLVPNALTYLTGGMTTFLTVSNRYIVCNTDPENRTVRFTIFQIYLVVALAIGSLIGGNTLILVYDRPQLRNYDINLYIVLGLQIISFIMILLIRIDRKPDKMVRPEVGGDDREEESITDNSMEEDRKSYCSINQDQRDGQAETTIASNDHRQSSSSSSLSSSFRRSTDHGCVGRKNVLAIFFEWDNVRATYRCLMKPREHHARERVILLTVLLFMFFVIYMGLDSVFLSFSQKVYQFDAKTFSMVSAFSKIVPNIVLAFASYIFTKWLKLTDGTTIALSISAGVLSQTLIGTFTTAMVYLISLVVGSIFGLASIIMKTKLSKLVAEDEIGKIFSIASTLESAAPLLGTLLFTSIFSATISTYPTLIYHVAALITLICLVAAMYEDLYLSKPGQERSVE